MAHMLYMYTHAGGSRCKETSKVAARRVDSGTAVQSVSYYVRSVAAALRCEHRGGSQTGIHVYTIHRHVQGAFRTTNFRLNSQSYWYSVVLR